jgi:DNA polymerase-3 subunit delta
VKLPTAQIASFLAAPPATIAVALIYGPDEGLVRERAETLVRAVLGGAHDDPFRLALLTMDQVRQDPARLADEASSLSLMGGRRAIRVREAGDAIAKTVQFLLEQPTGDSLTVIEAGSLDAKSSLRKLCEADGRSVAIACYADGPRELAETMRETFTRHRITLDRDAQDYLQTQLGGDRMVTRQELEKLALYAGDGGRVSLEDAVASIGNTSTLAIDDVIYDAFDGRPGALDPRLDRLFLEGEAPVAILRAGLRHAQRLHLVGIEAAGGKSLDAVVASLRPPIFFKLADRFRAQAQVLTPPRMQRLLGLLLEAETQCKRTGYPDETICRHALLSVARLAASARR